MTPYPALLPAVLVISSLFTFLYAIGQDLPNGDFEGETIAPWRVTTPGAKLQINADLANKGKGCGVLTNAMNAQGPAIILQVIDAKPYAGKLISFTGSVRITGPNSRAQMWMRVDRAGGKQGFFDNMFDRPIVAPEWRNYSIEGNVDPDAAQIVVGVMLTGTGPALLDSFTLESLGDAVHADMPAAPLDARGAENFIALARLTGLARFFSASDASTKIDWGQFTLGAVERVEKAPDAPALAQALSELFSPVAPNFKVLTHQPQPTELTLVRPASGTHWTSWKHQGFGESQQGGASIYRSTRETIAIDAEKVPGTKPGTTVHRQIAPGVWVVAAVGAYSDESKTLPIADAHPVAGPDRPRGWKPSGDDRTTRLADIILAWGVLEHFYPYFDVVKADWDRALADGLTTAATDADGAAFQKTLSHLGSQLHDGHVWVGGKSLAAFALPISWTWAGDQLVITSSNAALSSGLTRGDVVESLNGETVAHSCDALRPFISGATEQWIRHRMLEELRMRETNSPVPISVRRITDEQLSVQLVPTARGNIDEGFSRPKDGSEVAPGVMYFDLCGKNAKALEDHLKDLVAAKAVIFDVRGYPGDAAFQLFPHLSEKPLKSATWRAPVYTMPDREGVTYIESAWDLQPAQPLIAGRKVFLTDGSAISYAESCMGIIEAYKLGDIVGSATAGTNGNVNTVSLPGGYSISFTGMQVLKHDGSTHHGVGIKPTIEVGRTVKGISEGRDEVLERAIAELK